jgi:hypothetical protein
MKFGLLLARQVAFIDTTAVCFPSPNANQFGPEIILGSAAPVGSVHGLVAGMSGFAGVPAFCTLVFAGVGVETVSAELVFLFTTNYTGTEGNGALAVPVSRTSNGSVPLTQSGVLPIADLVQSGTYITAVTLACYSSIPNSLASVTLNPFIAMQTP